MVIQKVYELLKSTVIVEVETEFVDLLTVANISILVFDHSLHGYYIHGKSPSGLADANFDEILKNLEAEIKGNSKGRGLDDRDADNLQSYEVYLSYQMRITYDAVGF